jgi:hypothetical protein
MKTMHSADKGYYFRQTTAQYGNPFRATGQGRDLFFERRKRGAQQLTLIGKERQPTPGDFVIGPKQHEIGTGVKHEVVMIFHDRKGADLDGEDGGKIP